MHTFRKESDTNSILNNSNPVHSKIYSIVNKSRQMYKIQSEMRIWIIMNINQNPKNLNSFLSIESVSYLICVDPWTIHVLVKLGNQSLINGNIDYLNKWSD